MDGKVRWGHRDKKDHPGPLGDKVPRETLVNRVLLGDPGGMVTPEHPETRVLEDLKVYCFRAQCVLWASAEKWPLQAILYSDVHT